MSRELLSSSLCNMCEMKNLSLTSSRSTESVLIHLFIHLADAFQGDQEKMQNSMKTYVINHMEPTILTLPQYHKKCKQYRKTSF